MSESVITSSEKLSTVDELRAAHSVIDVQRKQIASLEVEIDDLERDLKHFKDAYYTLFFKIERVQQ